MDGIPETGEEMLIKPRSSVVFRPSKLFAPPSGGTPVQVAVS